MKSVEINNVLIHRDPKDFSHPSNDYGPKYMTYD